MTDLELSIAKAICDAIDKRGGLMCATLKWDELHDDFKNKFLLPISQAAISAFLSTIRVDYSGGSEITVHLGGISRKLGKMSHDQGRGK